MKIVLLLLLLVGVGFAILLFPMVMKEKTCYDASNDATTDMNSRVIAQSLSKEDVCSRRSSILVSLETCLQNATASSRLAKHTNGVISQAVMFVHPFTDSVSTQIANHNNDCNDYSDYQL